MMKVVINNCFGGFGLSEAAYEWLIERGIPVKKYVQQERGPDGLYKTEPANEGEVIFDRDLEDENELNAAMRRLSGRYWETWLDQDRANPLLVECVESLGEAANGRCASLKVVEIPDDVDWEIDEYDGNEHIAEKHRTWG